MTVSIHLDVQALNALFPEGSEARAQLARGVIENFIRNNLKPQSLGQEVRDLIEKARKEAVTEALRTLGVSQSWGGGVSLSDSFTRKLREQATESIQAEITKEVDRVRAEVIGRIDMRLESSLRGTLDDRIQRAVRERVEAITTGLLKATS